jgi:hypothetical protein
MAITDGESQDEVAPPDAGEEKALRTALEGLLETPRPEVEDAGSGPVIAFRCAACQAAIEGAVFMSRDVPYCSSYCRGLKLNAASPTEKQDEAKARTTSRADIANVQSTGLSADTVSTAASAHDLDAEGSSPEGETRKSRCSSKCEREDAARICASDAEAQPGLLRLLGDAVLNKVEARVPSVGGLVNLAESLSGIKIRVRSNS